MIHLTAQDGNCVAACPACRKVRECIHELEDALVSLRIENKALRDESDEANATAVDFANQANELHRSMEKLTSEHKEMLALLRKTEQLLIRLQSTSPINPLFQWTVKFPGDEPRDPK